MVTALPEIPALVPGRVIHRRRERIRHGFDHRVYSWLVDADHLPRLPRGLRPFGTFRAADHLGDPALSIGENVRRFCAARGVQDVAGCRVLMLANARVLGHVFDPLSVFWLLADDQTVPCVVAEVHNTYGERHAYLLRVDEQGRSKTDKVFYVSPFFTVDGHYRLRFELGAEQVTTTVELVREGRSAFTAVFTGRPQPLTHRRLLRLAVTQPLMTWRVSLLIRMHGIALWLRRIPIVARTPHHQEEEGVR